MPSTGPTPSVTANQLTQALGEAVIRIWSNLPQEVQNRLFQEAVTSHGETIRLTLAVFLLAVSAIMRQRQSRYAATPTAARRRPACSTR